MQTGTYVQGRFRCQVTGMMPATRESTASALRTIGSQPPPSSRRPKTWNFRSSNLLLVVALAKEPFEFLGEVVAGREVALPTFDLGVVALLEHLDVGGEV